MRGIIMTISVGAMLLAAPVLAADDRDNDGLSDADEAGHYHTDPDRRDTDGDGYDDGDEISHGYSPRHAGSVTLAQADSDSDGLSDHLELALGADLLNPDSDSDGYQDGREVHAGYNPLASGDDRSLPKRAEVNLSTQQLDYFMNDVQIGTIPVSTGLPATPTPTGTFTVMKKLPFVNYRGVDYNYPNTKWNLRFKTSYYLHGAFWHNQFGQRPMSHGCVNIGYADAERLYHFLDEGNEVRISGTTPRGRVTQR